MIAIDQLRYVRLGTRDLSAAVDFAGRILALQLVNRSENTAYFRSDMRDHTLVFFLGESTESAVGFEIHGQAQFDAAITELSQHGIEAGYWYRANVPPRGTCAPWRVFAIPTAT